MMHSHLKHHLEDLKCLDLDESWGNMACITTQKSRTSRLRLTRRTVKRGAEPIFLHVIQFTISPLSHFVLTMRLNIFIIFYKILANKYIIRMVPNLETLIVRKKALLN